MRHEERVENAREASYGNAPLDTPLSVEHYRIGAQSEMAVAKALNLYWSGMTFFAADVGFCVEVRCRSDNGRDMVAKDEDTAPVTVLVETSNAPTFRLVGWLKTVDCKRDEWRQRTGPKAGVYFVPRGLLRDAALLTRP